MPLNKPAARIFENRRLDRDQRLRAVRNPAKLAGTPVQVQPVIQKLYVAQETFLRAAAGISASNWPAKPRPHCWSAGQLVTHLCLVERGVLLYADRLIQERPRPLPFYRRLHLPLALVESRLVKRSSPAIVVPPDDFVGKEVMLAELRGVREKTLSFLEKTRGRELSRYFWRHPFLGYLNFYTWFAFIAAHQVRHSKQMWEIGQNLPKDVASSRKQTS
jgi:hypothetical protein